MELRGFEEKTVLRRVNLHGTVVFSIRVLLLGTVCKDGISPMNIVNIKKGSHTYSQQLVENIGCGLELNTDEMRCFVGVAGF